MKILKKIWFFDWLDALASFVDWFEEKCPAGTIGRLLVLSLAIILAVIFAVILLVSVMQIGVPSHAKHY
jgi:hypothetical protein